ncbi:arginine--tRNA ligase [Amycolatopsis panacis]|uniref:Arginine--tRNA ligase n=1 Tax=Amycolatopsis panacis TaxID=2340917 RepID=A0A419HW79_9PSEU|nr:arginine--tRNA ligase [Amycolatopsis panacis]RJQ81312.1 arginine--tRNA ligase [Amycolatopsis panacis]
MRERRAFNTEVGHVVHGDVGRELAGRIAAAVETSQAVGCDPADVAIRVSGRPGVDYQSTIALSLASEQGGDPQEIAAGIAAELDTADLLEPPEIGGPGFLNLVLRREWLEQRATALLEDARIGVAPAERPRRIAIDYSSPNVAKQMHVGHLRSSIIGDALARMLRFAGHDVTPHNHLGDWGTPFGMLIEHLVEEGWTGSASAGHTIVDLDGFYLEARKKFDADPDFALRARRRVVLLQGGDEQSTAFWRLLVDESTRHFEQVYDLLGVGLTPDDSYGESFYHPYLAGVVRDLTVQGLTESSDGAICAFPAGFFNRDGERSPLIVRKRGGGYGYAITDLATARYWIDNRGAEELLYVVGNPQAQHFAMIFTLLREAGWLSEDQRAEHIGFGSILGDDGKTIRSRAGGSVKLIDLLREAVERAAALVAERGGLAGDDAAEVARAVGIGAVKYADLSGNRGKDYTFDWDRMLAMDGNTAVYLQYANARIRSILRKAAPPAGTPVVLADPAERRLMLKILQFPQAFDRAVTERAPHRLCTYLYDTARAFSGFYESCPILTAAPDLRDSRLVLVLLTSRVLTLGLSLLGIEAPERL